jgi:hypothetical protein
MSAIGLTADKSGFWAAMVCQLLTQRDHSPSQSRSLCRVSPHARRKPTEMSPEHTIADFEFGRIVMIEITAPLDRKHHDGAMFRTLATLAVAVSIDLYLFDGRYFHAAEQMAIAILQQFRIL